MDPNTALESILHGHMMLDHCEALRDWLLRGGFRPAPVWRPVDVAPFFAGLPFEQDLTADLRGLVLVEGDVVLFTWDELLAAAAEEDEGE